MDEEKKVPHTSGANSDENAGNTDDVKASDQGESTSPAEVEQGSNAAEKAKGKIDQPTSKSEAPVAAALSSKEGASKTAAPVKKGNFFKWAAKNKSIVIPAILILLLVGTFAYFKIRLATVEADFIIQKENDQKEFAVKQTALQRAFENKIDSLNMATAYQLSKVFSYSVRAELMRGNNEYVSILFNQFIKTTNVQKISLIDPQQQTVMISTDKKVEGEPFTGQARIAKMNDGIVNNSLIIPVLGISETIGYLEFTYSLRTPSAPATPVAKTDSVKAK